MGGIVDDVMGPVNDVLGGITGSTAAADAMREGQESAAAATLASTEKNIDFQKWLWGEQKGLAQPYADMGAGAIGDYQEMLDQPIDVYSDPSYQFRKSEGQKAYENSASAKGMVLAGQQANALTRYGSDYPSTEYGKAFNRRQTNFDNLY